MQIRRLRNGDEAVARRLIEEIRLAQEDPARTVDPAYMRIFLADDRNYLIAAHVDDAPAGFILGYRFRRVDGPRPMMFLYEIGVHEHYRRRGIGRALIEELRRFAIGKNCLKMFVLASASNEAAMALYRSAGGVGGAQPDAAAFEWMW